MDCRVRTSLSIPSTLVTIGLLIARLKTPRRKKDRNVFIKTKKQAKFDVKSLKVEYVRSGFIEKVDSLYREIENNSIGVKDFMKHVEILENAARATIPNVIKSVEARIWDNDEELKKLLEARDPINRNLYKNEFQFLTSQIKKRFDYLCNMHSKEQADDINEACEARNLEKLFRLEKRQHQTQN